MVNALKSLENNTLAALSARAPQGVVNAIRNASAHTGVSFSYLMEKAAAESNFNPLIKATTSSATGLFQFIESTWMNMVKKYGAKYGIDTAQNRQSLLNLRKDPQIASYMAAEFAQENKQYLKQTIGGDIGNTELYFAHFMGAGGASAFLSQLKKNPLAVAADLFPKEARANQNIFYDRKTGTPKTLQQVYDFFDKKFSDDTTPAESDNIDPTAYKSKTRGEGYRHMPLDNPRSLYVQNELANARNAIQRLTNNHAEGFYAAPTGGLPTSLYSNLTNPTSMLLDLLR